MENNNKEIWKYYKIGDVVTEAPGCYWEGTRFIITGFGGNAYCPIVHLLKFGKDDAVKNRCNSVISRIRLVGASKRPFISINKASLIKIMNKGNEEARREFIIRLNTKKL